jgi:hypothetical protein
MSRGPGTIERRIADLFAATRDCALDIETIARHAFRLRPEQLPTRAQRLSATRAAHRVVRRQCEMDAQNDKLRDQAFEAVTAKLGRARGPYPDDEYNNLLDVEPAYKAAEALYEERRRIGLWTRIWQGNRPGHLVGETETWHAITLKGRLRFYPGDVPAQVWAVTLDRNGVHWFDAEIVRITRRNVIVRYRGEIARLDRERLFQGWAFWRRVRFVSTRSGRIAAELEGIWNDRYGATGSVPPSMRMPLDQARQLLGVGVDYTKADVVKAFRKAAMKAHPDQGGTPEMFRLLVEARDRLLSTLGTSAPPPKPPDYAPKGIRTVYRVGRSPRHRLGSPMRRLTGT